MTIALVGLLAISGSGGASALNTATISQTPASAGQYAKAKPAAKVCAKLPNTKAVFSSFAALGYQENHAGYTLRNGESVTVGGYLFEDENLKVFANAKGCTIALVNMSPQQAYNLAKPWADKFQAQTNAELGQGLSDRVVQVWRSNTDDQSVMITAFRTWPRDYQVFGDQPGTVVTLGFRDRRNSN